MGKAKEHIYFAVCGNHPGGPCTKFCGMAEAKKFAREMRELGFNSTPGVRTDRNGENYAWEPVLSF